MESKLAPSNTAPDVTVAPASPLEFRRQMGHVSRHSAAYFAGTVFTAGAGYLFKVYLARVLGAEALGIYALGMTIVGFLGIFNTLGLPQAAVRFVAEYCASGKLEQLRAFLARGVAALLVSNLVLGAAVLWVGPWIAVHFYHTPQISPYLLLFVLIMVLGVFNTFFGQVLAGFKDIARRTVISAVIARLLTILLTVVLVSVGMGLRGYIAAQVGAAAIVLVLLVATVRKLTPQAARSLSLPMPQLEKEVFSFSATVFAMDFLHFVLAHADKVLIGFYLNAREVGIYSVASAIVVFVPITLQSVNQIFSPTIADLHSRGESQLLGRMFQILTKWIIAFTIPLAAAFIIYSRPIMQIFGSEFEVGWPILIIGALGQLINCAVGSVGYLLLMSGRQRILLRIQIVMAALTLLLNILLIPAWGIVGAAVASSIVVIFTNLWSLWEVRSHMGLFPYNRSYIHLIIPVMASVGVLLLMRMQSRVWGTKWPVIAAGLVLAYGALIGASLLSKIDDDDRMIARAAWERLRNL